MLKLRVYSKILRPHMADAATIWPSPLSTMIDAITVITSGKKPNGLRHSSHNILNTLMHFVHLVSNIILANTKFYDNM